MLKSEIKNLFLARWDEFQSDYISDPLMTRLFTLAQSQVFNNNLIPSYQATKRIDEDLLVLKRVSNITPTSNVINLTTDLTDYNCFITALPKYVIDGVTYEYVAQIRLDVDKENTYTSGTLRYPRYEQYGNNLGEKILELQPDTTPTTVLITYFTNPAVINFETPDEDIPYSENTITAIIDKAIQYAGEAFRDPEFFNTATQLIAQSNTPTA